MAKKNRKNRAGYVNHCGLAAKLVLIMSALSNTAGDVEMVGDVEITHHFSVAEREVNRMMERLMNRIEEFDTK